MNKLEKYYTDFYTKSSLQDKFPNEFVIRIFRGNYPNLQLSSDNFTGKKICDIGFGDGRNLLALNTLGAELYGTEITGEICKSVQEQLRIAGINADLRAGENANLPFESGLFDYLLSWNACYYMGEEQNYKNLEEYVAEFARVLKPGGKLVLSIPMLSNFIYDDSKEIKPGYRLILNDPYKIRNGHVLKSFVGEDDIEKSFSSHFKDFVFGSINDDCFGQKNHWHLAVCTKKGKV